MTSHVWFKRSIQIVLGVCAVVLIVIGIGNGGMADVLAKAVKICTQCIGLG
ncbi:MAG: thioredoxin [Clostridia bacterium]|nr:thioredoxin [Clostridia bacterium]